MSSLDLRVELPTHSLSFRVQVPHSSTIRHVKEQIQRACPGTPRVDGQRIIWRGRFLKDEETVEDIWKSSEDSPVVHLSVHPSAWTGALPASAGQLPSPPLRDVQPPPPSQRASPTSTGSDASILADFTPGLPLAFISYQHKRALNTVTSGRPSPEAFPRSEFEYRVARSYAESVLRLHGVTWPSVLDEEYPPFDESIEGIRYEEVIIDNSAFLSLTTPNALPSPCQAHALNVLRSTYALLSIPAPDPSMLLPPSSQDPNQAAANTNLNHRLQQLGLPALRLAPNQNNRNPADPNNPLVPEMRAIPIRALMIPLMMLTFRTLLLVYFFSPSKRPLFGLVLCAWILYEAWNAFRMVLGNGNRPGPERDGAGAGDNADPVGDDGLGAPQAPFAPGAPRPAAGAPVATRSTASRSWTNALLDKLAAYEVILEEITIAEPLGYEPAPGIFQRVKTFCVLLLTTLHPAVWDRRRALLRRREGRLRHEANLRTSDVDEQDQSPAALARAQMRTLMTTRHERRPAWVKAYVERVLTTEWADDL